MSEDIDVETAVAEIAQRVEAAGAYPSMPPYFFLVGAGISVPSIPLAPEITELCRNIAMEQARKNGRSIPEAPPPGIDSYSYWMQAAFPDRGKRRDFLRKRMEATPLSPANLRLAHILCTKRVARLVVTPNFDDHLPRAMRLLNQDYQCCDHPETLARIELDAPDLFIAQVHGSYWTYELVNLKRERSERAASNPASTSTAAAFMDQVLTNQVPLVLGYRGWEDDVIMQALERRLRRPLRQILYWFCYRREDREGLPDWLKGHGDVRFVVPPQPTLTEGLLARNPQSSAITGLSDGADKPSILPAQRVLARLIQRCQLPVPPLVDDPVGFVAGQLRSALVHETGIQEDDPYSFHAVVARLELAHRLDQDAQKQRNEIEVELAALQMSIAGAQFDQAIEQARNVPLGKLLKPQLSTLKRALRTLADSEAVEVVTRGEAFKLLSEIADAEYRAGDRLGYAAKLQALLDGAKLGLVATPDAAATQLDEVLRLCEGHDKDLEIERLEARCHRLKISSLCAQCHFGQVLAATDRMRDRFVAHPDLEIRHDLVLCELAQLAALAGLHKNQEGESAANELARYYDGSSPDTVAVLASSHLMRAQELRQQGRLEDSLAFLRRILLHVEHLPERARADMSAMVQRELAFVGIMRRDVAMPESALASIRKLRSELTANLSAVLDMELPFLEEAIKLIRTGTDVDPTRLDELLRDAEASIEVGEQVPDLRLLKRARLAELYQELGRSSEARALTQELVDRLGENPLPAGDLLTLGTLLLHWTRRLDSAKSQDETALLTNKINTLINKAFQSRKLQGAFSPAKMMQVASAALNAPTVTQIREIIHGIGRDSGPYLMGVRGFALARIAADDFEQSDFAAVVADSSEALEFLDEALQCGQLDGAREAFFLAYAMALVLRAKGLLRQRKTEAAEDACAHGIEWLKGHPELFATYGTDLMQHRIACLYISERFAEGLEVANRLWEQFLETGDAPRVSCLRGASRAAGCAIRLGRIDLVETWAGRLLSHCLPSDSIELQVVCWQTQQMLVELLLERQALDRARSACRNALAAIGDGASLAVEEQRLHLQLQEVRIDLQVGHHKEALESLTTVARAASEHGEVPLRTIVVDALILRATAHSALEQTSDAKQALKQALHLVRPEDAQLLVKLSLLAQTWRGKGKLKLAFHLADRLLLLLRQREVAAGIWEDVLVMHANLAAGLMLFTDMRRDVEEYERFLENRDPAAGNPVQAQRLFEMRLLGCLASAKLDGPAVALTKLEAAVTQFAEASPQSPAIATLQARLVRVDLLKELKHFERLEAELRSLIAELTGFEHEAAPLLLTKCRLALAEHLEKQGDAKAALADYEQLLKELPGDPPTALLPLRENVLYARAQLIAATDPSRAVDELVTEFRRVAGSSSTEGRLHAAYLLYQAAKLCRGHTTLRRRALNLWSELIAFSSPRQNRLLLDLHIVSQLRRIEMLTKLRRNKAAVRAAERVVRRYRKRLRPKTLRKLRTLIDQPRDSPPV